MAVYAAAGMGATFQGPAGVLVSLGIESVLTNLAQITFWYNLFAIFTMMCIFVVASQRDARFLSILLPVWAGIEMYFGWLKYPDQAVGFGIIVVCTMIAIMTYMQETVHERFGIAGPGNKVIKIFTFLIILQCVVVFVNSSQIFPSDVPNLAASNAQYTNIDLQTQMTGITNSGGILNQIVDLATAATQIALASLVLLGKCLLSIALFSVVLAQVFPWIVQAGAIGIAFLVVMQFAIWIMYLLFIFTMFYRPSGDPGW